MASIGEIYKPNVTDREVRQLRLGDEIISYEVVEGVAVIGGDMVMGDVDAFEASALAAGSWHGVSKNSGVWSMPVRFKFDSGVPVSVRIAVNNAISELQSETSGVLTFEECGSTTTPVCGTHPRLKFIYDTDGCHSPLGQKTWPVINSIYLDTACDDDTTSEKGSIKHEILHSMGYDHEQSRCDRDAYVSVDLSIIIDAEEHNFDKRCGANWSDVVGYNYGSIMHYGSTAWRDPGAVGNTITTLDPIFQSVIGYRGPISAGDRAMIELKYGSPTLNNGSTCVANSECTSGNCVPTGWWVGASKKCDAVPCAVGDWDAQNYDDGVCDNACLLHVQELCPSGMACAGAGNGTCVDSCVNDNDCPADHPYCVYGDSAKFAKLCNKANCSPCEWDSTPNNLTCEGSFADGTSGDCGSGYTCFSAECVLQCTTDGQCGAGKTCEYANNSKTLKYCNTANCTSCEYDTYPLDNICSNNLPAGTVCGPWDECNGAGECLCTLTPNAMVCTSDSDCCSNHCEAANQAGTFRLCNRISCPAGQWDLDPTDTVCDNF